MPTRKKDVVLKARDVMTRSVITVRPDVTILEAVRILVSRNISGVPVTNDAGDLLGVLSEHDCLRVFGSGAYDGEHVHFTQEVSDLMTTESRTVDPDTDIYSIASLFLDERIRRAPVIDGQKLVGLVSRRDVLLGMAQMRNQDVVSGDDPNKQPKLYPSATSTSPDVVTKKLK